MKVSQAFPSALSKEGYLELGVAFLGRGPCFLVRGSPHPRALRVFMNAGGESLQIAEKAL